MEKVILEDGSEREVPTKEELDAFQQASQKAAEVEAALKTKEDEWKKKEEELNGMVNPNWRAAREKIERLEKLEAQGKTLDGEGKVVDRDQKFDPNELISRATEAGKNSAMDALLSERKRSLLSKYDNDTKTAVEHYFNKLITGEQLSLDNMEKFIKEAESLASPQSSHQGITYTNGNTPKFNSQGDGKPFSETDDAKDIAKQIWGDKAYSAGK